MNLSKYLYIAAALTFTACTNDGDIGDLYGQWQLNEVTADNGATTLLTYEASPAFISFQNLTVQTRVTYTEAHVAANVTGNYQHTGDSIFMQFYHIEDDYAELGVDGLLSTNFRFDTPRNMRFRVEQLNNKYMTLSAEGTYWNFKRH